MPNCRLSLAACSTIRRRVAWSLDNAKVTMTLSDAHARRLRRFARRARREILNFAIRPASAHALTTIDEARVVGLLSSASGIGNSARLNIASLNADGIAVQSKDVSAYFSSDDGLQYAGQVDGRSISPACTIYHLNPPMLLRGFLASGLRKYYASFNIGYWAWELETIPPEWRRAIDYVDAIFVPTEFCANAIASVTGKPVLVVPHPVARTKLADARPQERASDGPFTVLSIFNFGSSYSRKNPIAVIEAFKYAFKADEPARLVLKTSDGRRYPGELDRLKRAIAGHPNIQLIDAVWTETQMQQAYHNAGAFISLHRSEGFGLSIAEAIMQETPVVATAWSGNLDFCDPAATYLAKYTLVPFHDEHGDYAEIASAHWAEASTEHAGALLREIYDAPGEARVKAAQARRFLEAHLQRRTYKAALQELVSGAKTSDYSRLSVRRELTR